MLINKIKIIGLLLVFINCVNAADFCVTNSLEFQQALSQAEINAQNSHIKLVTGIYSTLDNGLTDMGFEYSTTMPAELIISGGWSQSGSGNCFMTRVLPGAEATILTGDNQNRVLSIAAGFGSAPVQVINLSIQSGFTAVGMVGGMYISGVSSSDYAGNVLVDRVSFVGNTAHSRAALLVESEGRVDVRNSLFKNNSITSSYAVGIENDSDQTAYFINNTVMNNNSTTNGSIGGVLLLNMGAGGSVAANNILWNNDSWDIVFSGTSANHHLLYNIIQSVTGNAGIDLDNSNENPLLNLDGSLTQLSPAIDAGLLPDENQPNPPVELDWEVGELDIQAFPRMMGATVDQGAFEFVDDIYSNGFE